MERQGGQERDTLWQGARDRLYHDVRFWYLTALTALIKYRYLSLRLDKFSSRPERYFSENSGISGKKTAASKKGAISAACPCCVTQRFVVSSNSFMFRLPSFRQFWTLSSIWSALHHSSIYWSRKINLQCKYRSLRIFSFIWPAKYFSARSRSYGGIWDALPSKR